MPNTPLAVGDIVQATIVSRVLNQTCLNVLHYRARFGLPQQTYEEAMDLLGQAIGGNSLDSIREKMIALMGDNTTVLKCRVQRVYPSRDFYIDSGVQTDGKLPSLCEASNLAFVATKRAQNAGRGRAGSFHLAGITLTHYEGGYLTENGRVLMTELADKLGDPLVADGGNFVFEPGMFNPNVGANFNWNFIGAVAVQDTVRVMRRRTVGLGI